MLNYLQMIESEDDKAKFEQLYLTYRGLMFYIANQILHNEQDAEDCVYQAFLSILENLNKISKVRCPKTRSYVVIIVERKSLDLLRKAKHETLTEIEDAFRGVEIPMPGDNGLADAMTALPADYREILLLRYDNGYSAGEIAKMLNITLANTRKKLWRAKRMLQECLERRE